MKRQAFQIGQWVRVTGYMERLRLGERRLIVQWRRRGLCPIVGQVVGATYRLNGRIEPGWAGKGFFEEDECEPTCFITTGRIFVWQVRFGLTNKPIEVLAKDLAPAESLTGGLPWSHSFSPSGQRQQRAWELVTMRHQAQEVSRLLGALSSKEET